VCLLRGTDWVFIYNSCYVFCVDLRTNSDYFPIKHQLIGLYNRDGVCLLRGTDWVFIYNSGYVFCVNLRTNSDYFPENLIWLFFVMTYRVFSVRWEEDIRTLLNLMFQSKCHGSAG